MPPTKAALKREFKVRSTRDLLLIAGVKASLIQLRELNGWELELAADWAGAVHLKASDNAIKIPARPRCLSAFPGVEGRR